MYVYIYILYQQSQKFKDSQAPRIDGEKKLKQKKQEKKKKNKG